MGNYRGLAPGSKAPEDAGAICLSKLRLDGFVSLDAGPTDATVLTKPLQWHGAKLWINADACGGEVRVEIVDAGGRLLDKKYSKDEAIPIDNDGVRLPVRWKSGANLQALEDRKVRLRFHLRNAKLYAFWTE